MSDSLATYLHDHLAGSNFAIKLLDSLLDQYCHEELGTFAAQLLADIQEDQDVLQSIIDKVGRSGVDLKEAVGWLAEKASKLKLHRDAAGGVGTFEALETLLIGITGKSALWRVLPVIAEVDTRVPALDYQQLAARAEEQRELVDRYRIKLASIAFKPER